MAVLSKIATITLRVGQLISAVVIVGLASDYIAESEKRDVGHLSRFIFADAAAVVSAFFAFIWLIPFSSNYMNWYIDGLVCLLLAAATGWLIYKSEDVCGEAKLADSLSASKAFDDNASFCDKWRALYVFAALAAGLWLLSAAVGFFWVKKNTRPAKAKKGGRRR